MSGERSCLSSYRPSGHDFLLAALLELEQLLGLADRLGVGLPPLSDVGGGCRLAPTLEAVAQESPPDHGDLVAARLAYRQHVVDPIPALPLSQLIDGQI